MLKIGITGQPGFIGTHLYNYLGLFKDTVTRIPFKDEFFEKEESLNEFVKQCDVIVHLAAVNRHHDPDEIFSTNIRLVKSVIAACETTNSAPHIIFSSSIQEERDNVFGKSKKAGRELFSQWAEKNNVPFTGMIIPNVFGPFGRPYYNSVVSTFSHQVSHGENPKIEVDAELKMIFVNDLVKEIYKVITEKISAKEYLVLHTNEIKVSDLLSRIKHFKSSYLDNNIIPDLSNRFDLNLFNSFICYIDLKSFYPYELKSNTDDRGSFVETIKLEVGGQISFSSTKPGITRGNHFHIRKFERFAVIKGKARIEIRRIGTDEVMSFELDGEKPSFVDMPIWHTHNITNIGDDELYTIFWINEFFDPQDPDTFFETV